MESLSLQLNSSSKIDRNGFTQVKVCVDSVRRKISPFKFSDDNGEGAKYDSLPKLSPSHSQFDPIVGYSHATLEYTFAKSTIFQSVVFPSGQVSPHRLARFRPENDTLLRNAWTNCFCRCACEHIRITAFKSGRRQQYEKKNRNERFWWDEQHKTYTARRSKVLKARRKMQ